MRRLGATVAAIVTAATVTVAVLPGPARADGWTFHHLPPGGGKDPAAIMYLGNHHVFSADAATGNLVHSWYTSPSVWTHWVLDGAVTGVSAVEYKGELHAFYSDVRNNDLRQAWYVPGAGWRFKTLDTLGGGATTALLYRGQPHVFYSDVDNKDLRHAWWDGSRWYREALDGYTSLGGRTTNAVGTEPVALLYFGQLQVFYADTGRQDLRHAWWDGSRWSFENLDGNAFFPGCTTNAVASSTSATLFRGGLHVFYRDDTAKDLRHAWYEEGKAWRCEALESAGDVGAGSSATVHFGELQVFYSDVGNKDLRHAWWNGTMWKRETLDGAGDVGTATSVPTYAGRLDVFYTRNGSSPGLNQAFYVRPARAVNVIGDSMLPANWHYPGAWATLVRVHDDLGFDVAANLAVAGSTLVPGVLQNRNLDALFTSAVPKTSVLLVSFSFNDFVLARATVPDLEIAARAFLVRAQTKGYGCVAWLQQRRQYRAGTGDALFNDRLADWYKKLRDIEREPPPPNFPNFRLVLVDWAPDVDDPAVNNYLLADADAVHQGWPHGGNRMGQLALQAMGGCPA